MKSRKILILLTLFLILLTVLRETGALNINIFNSKITAQTHSNWHNLFTTVEPSFYLDSNWRVDYNNECNFREIQSCPVSVFYKTLKFGDNSECKHIVVRITRISEGPIWTPFFKSANFEATASCNDGITVLQEKDNKKSQTSYQLNGTITVSGHIRVSGLSSYRNTKNLLLNYIVEQIYQSSKSKISGL